MEKLTSHPHIVDIYGYCGTTVVSEWGATGLDTLLAPPSQSQWLQPSVRDNVFQGITRTTPLGRLKLAREVAKGVEGLHSLKDPTTGYYTPILHADIQAKQFIVTQQGVTKINDFNRCRFLPYRKENKFTKQRTFCPISIPSAPGSQRSPEEYQMHPLTEKMDVFSLGNVLFHILTGQKPWGDGILANSVKKTIRNGGQPNIPIEYRKEGTFDAALSVLIDMAFEYDPETRIQASELVAELDRLIDAYPKLPVDLMS
jgi:serine/threonine protein kinase